MRFLREKSCLPLTPGDEKNIVTELIRVVNASMKEGDLFYLVPQSWWWDWQDYVNFLGSYGHSIQHSQLLEAPRPGKIDNSVLILEEPNRGSKELELKPDLKRCVDYTFVPKEIWKKLLEWYGGGPELARNIILVGQTNVLDVDVYPIRLHVIDARNNSQITIRMSEEALVDEVYNMVCTHYAVEKDKVCIWIYNDKKKHAMLSNFGQTLKDACLVMDQEILLEEKVDDSCLFSSFLDLFENESPQVDPASMDLDDMLQIIHASITVDRGLAGLKNLRNTCFMNSTLQCLVHTVPLVGYFLERNSQNPLGKQTKIAFAFGKLVRELLSAGKTSVSPHEFKAKLDQYAPRFGDGNQHDSQELLVILLDGLHEDLNRVANKPCIELKDANGRSDEEFADECWKDHKARNDSIVVEIFQGQYKSTLICLVCKTQSVRFDPFMYLSLPLPSTVKRTMSVTVFDGEGRALPKPFDESITLTSCLDAFLKEESLVWCCPSCMEDQPATKKIDLWRLPEILVVQLKRFSYELMCHKLDNFVDFPTSLDLNRYAKHRSSTYELYAVSNHYGDDAGHGHYTTYAKLVDDDGHWYHFDDELVSVVSEEEIRTEAAYFLFYRKVS